MIIITPTLGSSGFLDETVRSCETVIPSAVHVLCCPPARCEALRRRYPRCSVVPEGAGVAGVYGAINHVLKMHWGHAGWFSYINDDDLLMPGFARAAELAADSRSMDIIYGQVEMIARDGRPITRITVARKNWHIGHYFRTGIVPFTQQGTLIRASMVKQLGGFDTRYNLLADTDFFQRAFNARAKFGFVDAVVAQYRIRHGQLSSDLNAQATELREMLHYYPPPSMRWLSRFVVGCLGGLGNRDVLAERLAKNGRLRLKAILPEYQKP